MSVGSHFYFFISRLGSTIATSSKEEFAGEVGTSVLESIIMKVTGLLVSFMGTVKELSRDKGQEHSCIE